MGTINDKLTYLDGTKTAIRNVLNEQGVDITTEDTFRSYAQKMQDEFSDLNDIIEEFPTSTIQGTTISVDDCVGGKNPITIKGNTEQASYTGKNLFDYFTYPVNTTLNGVTITNNGDGSITLNGTCTADNTSFIMGSPEDIKNYVNASDVVQTAYYISGSCTKASSSNQRTVIRLSYETGYSGMIPLQDLATQRVISKLNPQNSTTTGWSWRIVLDEGDSFDNLTIKYQVEKGSTATDYEPYVGGIPSPNPDYPQDIRVVTGENTIEVQGKNLLEGFELGDINSKTGDTSSSSNSWRSTNFIAFDTSQTYYFSINNELAIKIFNLRWYNKDYEYIGYSSVNTGSFHTTTITKMTSVADDTPKYFKFRTGLSSLNDSDKVMVATSTATSYEPYYHQDYAVNLGSLELCKIGDYQDYIYKENGNWYKYGAIDKYVYNNDLINNAITEDFVRKFTPELNIQENLSTTNINAISYCNIIQTTTTGTTCLNGVTPTGRIRIRISTIYATTNEEFDSLCTDTNLTIYFGAKVPVITQITDETLIAQLEAIYKAKWNKGTNTITTTVESSNAVPELQATYKRYPKYQDKDVTVTSNGTTTIQKDEGYDAINSINLNVAVPPNWTELGYEDTPQTIIDGFNYAKQVQANWNPNVTSVSGKFQKNTNLLILPMIDTSNVTNFANFCMDARHLIYIPLIDTSKATTLLNAFNGVTIAEFPNLDTSNCTNFQDVFTNNKSLKHFKTINTNKGQNFKEMFKDCEQLQDVDILDLSSATNLQNMFQNCYQLTDYSLNNIMTMCIGATAYTGTKTLRQLGINSSKASRATQLENYQAFLDAGWTTGY